MLNFQDSANGSEEEDEWVEKVIGTPEHSADSTCETVTAGQSHIENRLKTDGSLEKKGIACFVFQT
jgi:hypothetical protein